MVSEKTKVKLMFPSSVSDSKYYRNLIDYSPTGYEYYSEYKSGLIHSNVKREVFKKIKKNVRSLFSMFKMSRPLYAKGSGNVNREKVIEHYAHCIPKKIVNDFVVDIEGVWQLSIGEMTDKTRDIISNTLLSDKCKAILPWTSHCYTEFVETFPELESKTILLRPATPVIDNVKFDNDKVICLLYASRDFELKGGKAACVAMDSMVETFKMLKDDVKFYCIAISNVGDKYKDEYKNITFLDLVKPEEMYKYYALADIFVYPSPVDTFGFSIIEAMSYNTPTIAIKTKDTKSVEEIIVNGYNGFYSEEGGFFLKFFDVVHSCALNKHKLHDIRKNCEYTMKHSQYNIEVRNAKLKKILDKCG